MLFSSCVAFSQGCSDAGFCTMGAMKPDQPFNKKLAIKLRSIEMGFYRGTTPLTPIIYVATLDFNFSLNAKTAFQVKLPYQAVHGQLANTSGVGDISLCITRTLLNTEKFDINFSIGGKIPTNSSDKDAGGYPLPMYYQTSLGTYDFITGISLISRNWLLATGIQHPFNRNDNQFLWEAWKGTSEEGYINLYNQARALKRGTDIMLRVERNWRFSRLNFSLGLLPIYRINNDEITVANGTRSTPKGARGLALSGIFTTGYSFNVKTGVKLLIGHKIIQRDNNPDGLTRELVTTVGYYYRF
ncbi:hypothetical protein [Chryseolinea sp. H1M3-3]|uniref:hypothetical protein n=1 Tax=Chryseolinea sp. H1M3-3 TaxID=3034144 RepID=UPI0023EC850D|nr:hypothetical protein [Chryseolinea sp. H1M3-3]